MCCKFGLPWWIYSTRGRFPRSGSPSNQNQPGFTLVNGFPIIKIHSKLPFASCFSLRSRVHSLCCRFRPPGAPFVHAGLCTPRPSITCPKCGTFGLGAACTRSCLRSSLLIRAWIRTGGVFVASAGERDDRPAFVSQRPCALGSLHVCLQLREHGATSAVAWLSAFSCLFASMRHRTIGLLFASARLCLDGCLIASAELFSRWLYCASPQLWAPGLLFVSPQPCAIRLLLASLRHGKCGLGTFGAQPRALWAVFAFARREPFGRRLARLLLRPRGRFAAPPRPQPPGALAAPRRRLSPRPHAAGAGHGAPRRAAERTDLQPPRTRAKLELPVCGSKPEKPSPLGLVIKSPLTHQNASQNLLTRSDQVPRSLLGLGVPWVSPLVASLFVAGLVLPVFSFGRLEPSMPSQSLLQVELRSSSLAPCKQVGIPFVQGDHFKLNQPQSGFQIFFCQGH